ncbi:TPA: hypothetical protein L3817_005971 [Pseudomonas aeruginosa]|nr:hypothetical protein [Pseudomonas aeruginosa]HBN8769375.1 hypothetical protein [Pseudomonas aeruginosa]HBN9257845.1 hypothetical protein [Pseudomonas aeruginosa]
MSIDWNTAPEGATHWEPSGPDFNKGWMKKEGNEWFYWSEGSNRWFQGKLSCNVSADREATFEARPQEAWDGRGLPPVGIECEFSLNVGSIGWAEGRVIGHDGVFAVISHKGKYYPRNEHGVRPIRTHEQIAAEERRKSILHLANLLIDSRGQCNEYSQAEAIFDAGYRRQEEGK